MTLVEILVVMGVIIVLVSTIVVATMRFVSVKSQTEGTKGLLEKLALGLEAYKATFGMYPPQDNIADPIGSPPPPWPDYPQLDVNPSATLQVQASTFVLWQALEYDGQGAFMKPVDAAYKAVALRGYNNAASSFTDSKIGTVQTWYYYQDAWRQPIRYLCPRPPYNQYILTSGGPDLVLDTADDMVKP